MKSVYDVNNQTDWANLLLQLQELEGCPWQWQYLSLKSHKTYGVWANMWDKEEMERFIQDNKIEF